MNKAQAQALLDEMTPGPWQVDGEEIQCASDASFICTVTGGNEDQDAADRAAIASLPDLLKAYIAQSEELERWQTNSAPKPKD